MAYVFACRIVARSDRRCVLVTHSNSVRTADSAVSFQIPSNMIAGRVAWPGMYICLMCAGWGIVSACTGAVQSYVGLIVCRLFLGVTEAAFFPGAFFLVSCNGHIILMFRCRHSTPSARWH